jgi:SpoVK/Ycf46/Vps4 family AAA+-type ATPase
MDPYSNNYFMQYPPMTYGFVDYRPNFLEIDRKIGLLTQENDLLRKTLDLTNKNMDLLHLCNSQLINKFDIYDNKLNKILEKDSSPHYADPVLNLNKNKKKQKNKKKNFVQIVEDDTTSEPQQKNNVIYTDKNNAYEQSKKTNGQQPLSKFFSNLLGDNDSSVVIQVETFQPSGFNLFDPMKLLNSLTDGKDIKEKDKPDTNIEESEDESVSECASDIEVEDLGITISSLDDLIELGSLFEKLNKPPVDSTTEYNSGDIGSTVVDLKNPSNKTKIENILSKYGLSEETIATMVSNKEIKLIKNTQESSNKSIIDQQTVTVSTHGLYMLNGKHYSLNLETLHRLTKPLNKLKNTIGMESIKGGIFDMILYYLQNFERKNKNMLHTVIEGPPGVGKTMVGKIIAEIYAALGVIPSNKFKLVKRTDLIGEYVGHTAPKTQKAIDEANGGVLFIDEAYALGADERKDSFSKECIDTLNQNLSENKNKFICIIAGYPNELEECFFAYNPGLKRRFPFKYSIEGYKPKEMSEIFMKMLRDSKWKLDVSIVQEKITGFFEEHNADFKNFGGDLQNLIVMCKFCHSRRIAGKHPKLKRKLILEDIFNGFDKFNAGKKQEDESWKALYN